MDQNRIQGKIFWGDTVFSFILGLIVVAILYPGFILLTQYPMQGLGHELQDPVAGYLNFIPGLRVFVYELLHNHNILWSNLRGFGLPLLGHDIQVAPLFPLTWLALVVPEPYFWNVMISFRLAFLFSGAYLLGFYVFRFRRSGAILFALTFIFNGFVLRYLNHPLQNGLLAGIWYFLFVALTVRHCPKNRDGRYPYWLFVALVVSVYCMVTNGFPEEAMLFGIVLFFMFPFLLLDQQKNTGLDIGNLLKILIFAHVLGFALGSIQIFPFFELLHSRIDLGCRKSLSTLQFHADQIRPFLAANLANWGQQYGGLHRSTIGLVVFFFSLTGICSRLIRPRTVCWLDIGVMMPPLFYVLKNFPLFPALTESIGAVPLVNELRFYVYCFSYLQLFFSYFAAVGFLFLLDIKIVRQQKMLAVFISMSMVLLAAFWSTGESKVSLVHIFAADRLAPALVTLYLLIVLVGIVVLVISLKEKKYISMAAVLIVVLALGEIANDRPDKFIPMATFSDHYLNSTTWADSLDKALRRENIEKEDVRTNDKYGRYLLRGISTVDHGAPAIIPGRNLLLRRAVYDGPFRGFFELATPLVPYADDIIGYNLVSDNIYRGKQGYGPDWSRLRLVDNFQAEVDGLTHLDHHGHSDFVCRGDERLIEFSGWALKKETDPEDFEFFFVLSGQKEHFITPIWRVKRGDIAQRFMSLRFKDTGWRARLDPGIFHEHSYAVELRLYDAGKQQYGLVPLGTLQVTKPHHLDELYPFKEIDSIGGTHVHVRKNSLSRAYMAGSCAPAMSPDDIYTELHGKDGSYRKGMAYVEELGSDGKKICRQLRQPWRKVPVREDKGVRVSLGQVQGPGILILSDSYYPGWHAYDRITGEEIKIRPANISFRALVLPEKRRYSIDFLYRPRWLVFSLLLSGGSFFVLVLLGWKNYHLMNVKDRG